MVRGKRLFKVISTQIPEDISLSLSYVLSCFDSLMNELKVWMKKNIEFYWLKVSYIAIPCCQKIALRLYLYGFFSKAGDFYVEGTNSILVRGVLNIRHRFSQRKRTLIERMSNTQSKGLALPCPSPEHQSQKGLNNV